MTLSISGIDSRREKMAKTGFAYLFATLFCMLFGAVYEHFSHQVFSYYMVYAFVFPMGGGVLPFFVVALTRYPLPSRISRNLYHSGIAALTVGSIFQGVLEIYGTTNRLVFIYWIAGTAFILCGIIFYLIGSREKEAPRSHFSKGGKSI